MPFAGASSDAREIHFATGLSDQIRIMLARLDALRIIAKSSVTPYADTDRSVRQIGEVLGVNQILSGSVVRSSDRVRVRVELIDTATQQVLWADSFDADLSLENVLDIQDRIAGAVANELVSATRTKSVSDITTLPQSLDALDAYHDGLYFFNLSLQRNSFEEEEESGLVNSAIEKFNEAINTDPGWAQPRAMLGRLYHFLWNATHNPDHLANSRRHIFDALQLDAEYAPAVSSNAYLLSVNREFDAALEEYKRSISLGSPDAYWGLGIMYRYLSRHREAIEAFQRAVSVDPLIMDIRWQLAHTYFCAGDYEAAIEDLEQYFPPQEWDIPLQILMAEAYARTGDEEHALQIANEGAIEIDSEDVFATTIFLAGDSDRALAAVTRSEETAPFVVIDIAPAAVLLGDNNRALTMLEEAAAIVSGELDLSEQMDWIWKLRGSPALQSLRGNARFEAILQEFGLPD